MAFTEIAKGQLRIDNLEGADIGPDVLAAWNYLNRGITDYGGEIVISPGQYKSSRIVLPAFHFEESRVSIRSAARSTIISPHGGGWTGQPMWEIEGGESCVSGIGFANPEHKNAVALLWQGASPNTDKQAGGTVESCKFTDWVEAVANENMGGLDLLRNRFISNDISYHSRNGAMIANLVGNRIMGGRGAVFRKAAAPAPGWASEGRVISGNQMVLMQTGIEIYNGLAYTISNNNIDADFGECIKIFGTPESACDDIKISGGWLSGSGSHAVRVEGVARRVSIANVSAYGHTGAAILLKGAGVIGATIEGLAGAGNQADIFVDGAREFRVSGSGLRSAFGFATQNNGETGVVHDNYVKTWGFVSPGVEQRNNKVAA